MTVERIDFTSYILGWPFNEREPQSCMMTLWWTETSKMYASKLHLKKANFHIGEVLDSSHSERRISISFIKEWPIYKRQPESYMLGYSFFEEFHIIQ